MIVLYGWYSSHGDRPVVPSCWVLAGARTRMKKRWPPAPCAGRMLQCGGVGPWRKVRYPASQQRPQAFKQQSWSFSLQNNGTENLKPRTPWETAHCRLHTVRQRVEQTAVTTLELKISKSVTHENAKGRRDSTITWPVTYRSSVFEWWFSTHPFPLSSTLAGSHRRTSPARCRGQAGTQADPRVVARSIQRWSQMRGGNLNSCWSTRYKTVFFILCLRHLKSAKYSVLFLGTLHPQLNPGTMKEMSRCSAWRGLAGQDTILAISHLCNGTSWDNGRSLQCLVGRAYRA